MRFKRVPEFFAWANSQGDTSKKYGAILGETLHRFSTEEDARAACHAFIAAGFGTGLFCDFVEQRVEHIQEVK